MHAGRQFARQDHIERHRQRRSERQQRRQAEGDDAGLQDHKGAAKPGKDGANPSEAQPLAEKDDRQQGQDQRLHKENGNGFGHGDVPQRCKEKCGGRRQQQATARLQAKGAGRNSPQFQIVHERQHQCRLHEEAPEGDFKGTVRFTKKFGEYVQKRNDQHAGTHLCRTHRMPCIVRHSPFHRCILPIWKGRGQSGDLCQWQGCSRQLIRARCSIIATLHQRATARKIRGSAMPTALMEKCHKKGIRMTSQRQVIVGVIGDSEDHPDVDELYRRAVDEDSTISIATVYRTVKLLEEAGVIERLEFGDGRARYEEAGEHHEHLVDVETGEVIEFYHAELEALKEQIAKEMGYELVDHRLELFGRKLPDNKS